jgi:hypothetical protein
MNDRNGPDAVRENLQMPDLGRDDRLIALHKRLVEHPLYAALKRPDDVLTFMRHHVFCVWDFMSLLKGLQQRLSCVAVPWLPSPDPEARRLVNEIVLAEESDEDGQGGWLSHFELYLAAMREAGADAAPVVRFLEGIRGGIGLSDALNRAEAPPAVAASVRLSLDLARNAETHRLAAAFALGREDVIPSLFLRLLDRLAVTEPNRFRKFQYYLHRHVDLDGDIHGPQALRLVERLCGGDPRRLSEALATAWECLEARLGVWDEILAALGTPAARRRATTTRRSSSGR